MFVADTPRFFGATNMFLTLHQGTQQTKAVVPSNLKNTQQAPSLFKFLEAFLPVKPVLFYTPLCGSLGVMLIRGGG